MPRVADMLACTRRFQGVLLYDTWFNDYGESSVRVCFDLGDNGVDKVSKVVRRIVRRNSDRC